MARACSSAVKTGTLDEAGEVVDRVHGLMEAVELVQDGVERIRLEAKLEQSGGIAARHTGNDGVLALGRQTPLPPQRAPFAKAPRRQARNSGIEASASTAATAPPTAPGSLGASL